MSLEIIQQKLKPKSIRATVSVVGVTPVKELVKDISNVQISEQFNSLKEFFIDLTHNGRYPLLLVTLRKKNGTSFHKIEYQQIIDLTPSENSNTMKPNDQQNAGEITFLGAGNSVAKSLSIDDYFVLKTAVIDNKKLETALEKLQTKYDAEKTLRKELKASLEIAEKKGFLDSNAGKMVLEQAPTIIEGLGALLKKTTTGLSGSTAKPSTYDNLSTAKKDFVDTILKDPRVTDTVLQESVNAIYLTATDPNFKAELQTLINNYNPK